MLKTVYIASCNPTKVEAVNDIFPNNIIKSFKVKTEINDQPLTDIETIKGAYLRALQLPVDGIRIGLEAGVKIIGTKVFLINWGILIDENNKVYLGGGTIIPLPSNFKKDLFENKIELAIIMDNFLNEKDIRSKQGAIGVFTNDLVQRKDIFVHIVKLLHGEYLANNYVDIFEILTGE